MSTKKSASEEEIELGNLFLVIGKGFSKLFKFIGKIFTTLFNVFISLLLFIKKHILKLAITAVIGFVIGYLLEGRDVCYQSNLIVEPNFYSTQQLYNTIEGYNNLVKQKDSITIAKIFNLTIAEAKSLKSIKIEPVISKSDQIKIFNDFIIKVDTTTIRNVEFDKFINNLTIYDYTYHNIRVKSEQKDIFKNLEPIIINSITQNSFFNTLKKTYDDNFVITEHTLLNEQLQLDSLRKIYNNVLLKEADKPIGGTNIDLAQTSLKKEKELELFRINLDLNRRLTEAKEDKAQNDNIINVISSFSEIGSKESILKRTPFLFALGLTGLTFLILLLLKFNKFLNKF